MNQAHDDSATVLLLASELVEVVLRRLRVGDDAELALDILSKQLAALGEHRIDHDQAYSNLLDLHAALRSVPRGAREGTLSQTLR